MDTMIRTWTKMKKLNRPCKLTESYIAFAYVDIGYFKRFYANIETWSKSTATIVTINVVNCGLFIYIFNLF